MNILALDLGTRCGWALHEQGVLLASGTQTFDVKRGESPGMRYVRLMRWLDEIGAKAEIVVYEAAHQRGGAATEIAAGFATHVQAWCALRGIEHSSVHSLTLKKWTTGSGKSDKSAMMSTVRRRWKEGIATDDEADAVALAMYALSEIVP